MSNVEKSTEKMFENMDFTSNKAQEIMLNVLWFTGKKYNLMLEFLVFQPSKFQGKLSVLFESYGSWKMSSFK